jgi:hypothetical protein
MIEICPTGPPKLMKPSLSQNQKASENGTDGGFVGAVGNCAEAEDALKASSLWTNAVRASLGRIGVLGSGEAADPRVFEE